jgi:hypothetical protein
MSIKKTRLALSILHAKVAHLQSDGRGYTTPAIYKRESNIELSFEF